MKLLLFRCFCVLFFICECASSTIYNPFSSISMCFRCSTSTADVSNNVDPSDPWWFNFIDEVHGNSATLNEDTKPLHYWLEITPNGDARTYKGNLTIKIMALKTTKKIRLNYEKLEIQDVVVADWDFTHYSKIKPKLRYDEHANQLIINTRPMRLFKDFTYKVQIQFKGFLYQSNPFGFAWYQSGGPLGKPDAYMMETNFNPVFARRTFPSYDEPKFKSQFTLLLKLNEDERAISNMVLDSERLDIETNTKVVKFDSSLFPIPPSSIYFAIIGKGYREINLQDKYFVWTVAEYIDQVKYAVNELETVAQMTKSLFSSVIYDLGRIDLVVPIRYEYYYPELSFTRKNLLCIPHLCPEAHQETVTRNVIRQVMLKWLTECISTQSWSRLWFRDGLTTYYENKLLDMMKPEWRTSDMFSSVTMEEILFNDFRTHYYPLVGANNPTKRRLFQLTYDGHLFKFYNDKAALIINMVISWIGEREFDIIMDRLMRDGHELGYIVPEQLWIEMGRILWYMVEMPIGEPLPQIMQQYTTQPGYPLLYARRTNERNSVIAISQEPYLYFEFIKNQGARANQQWIVPVTMTTQNKLDFDNTTPIAWSAPREEIFVNHSITDKEWFILNLKNKGYQRVNYDMKNWKLLTEQLLVDATKIHHLNRIQLISDSHVLAADAIISLAIPIRMFTYMTTEEDPLVWLSAFDSFERLYFALGSESRQLYQNFFTTCLKQEYERVDFQINPTDDHVTKLLKRRMMKFLCSIGDKRCVDTAKKMYYANAGDLASIDPNLKSIVFCTMLRGEDSQSVAFTLTQSLLESKNACDRDAVKSSAHCRHLSFDLSTDINNLLQNTINGDATAKLNLQRVMDTFSWNTQLIVLEKIQDTINEWVRKKQEKLVDASNNEIQNLASFVSYFEQKMITGTAEADVFLQTYELVEKHLLKDPRYRPLTTVLSKIKDNFWLKYGAIQHPLVYAVLSSYSCDKTTLKPFELNFTTHDGPVTRRFDPTPAASQEDVLLLRDFMENLNEYFTTNELSKNI